MEILYGLFSGGMPTMPPCPIEEPTASAPLSLSSEERLTWSVHLLRRDPGRLTVLALSVSFAALCVWLIFRAPLPTLAAVVVLLGALQEYLLPIRYELTQDEARAQNGWTTQSLRWQEMQRMVVRRGGVLLSPFAVASRRDAFRGVLLRFAPSGEPGDRTSTLAAIERFAPHLTPERNEAP
jgi:hypothetical protein